MEDVSSQKELKVASDIREMAIFSNQSWIYDLLLKKGEALGRRLVVALDGSNMSDYVLDWCAKNVFQEDDKVVPVMGI